MVVPLGAAPRKDKVEQRVRHMAQAITSTAVLCLHVADKPLASALYFKGNRHRLQQPTYAQVTLWVQDTGPQAR
jgi:agmatine/peptidylarginine deiminase